jgi:hypothetical protein
MAKLSCRWKGQFQGMECCATIGLEPVADIVLGFCTVHLAFGFAGILNDINF